MDISMLERLRENIAKVIVGSEGTTELLLAALLADGHVLLEDMPGTGKTLLAKTLARSIDADFGRVQFTPDLLPSDVTGLSYFDSRTGGFTFAKGPAFCNILLADEVNRATPKTQSSLLECMAERQITVDGETRPLPRPFFVIATENPIETLGTFPLPEAQMDRFLMLLSMEPLSAAQEAAMLERFQKAGGDPLSDLALEPVCGREDVLRLQDECRNVYVHPELRAYIVALCQATRTHPGTACGASPRGSLALMRAAQGCAMIGGRGFVVPEDVSRAAVCVLAHRIVPALPGASARDASCAIVRDVLERTKVPTEDWEAR